MSFLHDVINSGITETIILTILLMLLVINELFSGIEITAIRRIRRFIQFCIIPMGLLFILVAVIRMAHLI